MLTGSNAAEVFHEEQSFQRVHGIITRERMLKAKTANREEPSASSSAILYSQSLGTEI